jgi:hypothetical protein
LRIAIDATRIDMPGGGRFTALSLVQGVLQEDPVNEYVILVNREEASLRPFANAEQRVISAQNRFGVRAQTQVLLPGILRQEKIDIVHLPRPGRVFCRVKRRDHLRPDDFDVPTVFRMWMWLTGARFAFFLKR